MNKMKKFMASVLAIVMMMAMTIPVLAAGEGSITVTGQQVPSGATSITYEAYRIFDVSPAKNADDEFVMNEENYKSVTYTINTAWNGFFAEGNKGAKYLVEEDSGALPQVIVDNSVKYINITDSNVATFAKDALNYSQTQSVQATASNTTGEFTGLDLGYYMVYPKGASVNVEGYTSIVSLTTTNPSQEVAQKAVFPTITKTDNKTAMDLGDVVSYTITGKVPDTTGFTSYTYTIKDTMSNGLTYKNDMTVKIGGTNVTEKCTITTTGITETVHVTIPVMNYQGQIGADITVTYSAVLDSDAANKSILQEKNTAALTYSSDPKNTSTTITTAEVETKVYTSNIVIDKYESGSENNKLAKAEFVLYKKDAQDEVVYYKVENDVVSWVSDIREAAVVTTDSAGKAVFNGVADGTYFLKETVAPDGYNLLTKDTEVTVAGDDDNETGTLVTASVANQTGALLPTTGGIGTTIFYVIGGIMVVGAVIVLIARKRMDSER